ncbi:MAG: OmpA family protein [Bacteroidia bacterium]|nr:OmpA family protein [Bacteroidia bacterium]
MSWLKVWVSLGVAVGQVILREKLYGGSMADVMVKAFADAGGYWLMGYTRSRDGMLKRKGYDADLWVIRTDKSGEVLWHQVYGAEGDEELSDALPLSDGGFILVGWSDSHSLTKGKRDAYILRIDPLGKVLWSRCFGGSGNDVALGAALHPDGSLWVVGYIGSRDSFFHPRPYGGMDGWLIRLSLEGKLLGHACFGGKENDYLRLIIPLSPDTVWLVGASDSPDRHIRNPLGKMDIWLAEVNAQGEWQRSWNFGGADFEEPYSFVRSPLGDIWVAGTSFSPGCAVHGRADGVIWQVQKDGAAYVIWSGGGPGDEGLNFLSSLSDGSWLLAGMTSSRGGMIPALSGLYDAWAVQVFPSLDSVRFCYTFGGKEVESWIALFSEGKDIYVGCGTTASPQERVGARPYGSADFWMVWWHPDTTIPPVYTPPPAPTILLGYVFTEKAKVPVRLEFRSGQGELLDSVQVDTSGFFRWQAPDSLLSEVRVALFAKGYLWKEVSIRLHRHRENRVDLYMEKLRVGLKIPLFFVYFDKGSTRLKPESMPHLEQLLRFLQANPTIRIELSGHTDGTSPAESEIQLSRERAIAVRDYLVSKGIARDRLTVVGYGKSRPIADNETEEGQRRNRRVEMRIVGL